MPIGNPGLIFFLVVATFVILTLVIFLLLMVFMLQKRQQTFINELKNINLFYDKELLRAQLEIQEETFEHISREIHDNVGQFLSLAKLTLNMVDTSTGSAALAGINDVTELLGTALEDLRDLSRSMNSEVIKTGGLKKAIEMQINYLQKGDRFKVIFEIKGQYTYLNEQKEVIIFRILQEAINNIIRHSAATEILIFLCLIKKEFKLYIQDNGKGFDTKHLYQFEQSKLGGLKNMHKRAKLIDAKLDIESAFGKGTKITVTTSI